MPVARISTLVVGLLALAPLRAAWSTPVTFGYDAEGERIRQVDDAGLTTLYPFGDDYEVAAGTVTKYIHLGTEVIAKRVGPETSWLHDDVRGSVVAVSSPSGAIRETLAYRPYGDRAPLAGTSIGFTGERQDPSTGLVYLHARYYDPVLGRFCGPDAVIPTTRSMGLNRYAYAIQDPINNTDKSGFGPDDGPSIRADNSWSSWFWHRTMIGRQLDRSGRAFQYHVDAAKENIDGMWRGTYVQRAWSGYLEWTAGNRRWMNEKTNGWSGRINEMMEMTGGIGMGVPMGGMTPMGSFARGMGPRIGGGIQKELFMGLEEGTVVLATREAATVAEMSAQLKTYEMLRAGGVRVPEVVEAGLLADGRLAASMKQIEIALETSAEEANLVEQLQRVANQNTVVDFAKMNEFFNGHQELGLDRISFIIDTEGRAYLSDVRFGGDPAKTRQLLGIYGRFVRAAAASK
jgi:RHS repeat-associated protein